MRRKPQRIFSCLLLAFSLVVPLLGTAAAEERNLVLMISNKAGPLIRGIKSKQSSSDRWVDCGLCGNGSYFELRFGRTIANWDNCHYDLMLGFETGRVLNIPNVDVCEKHVIVVRNQNNQLVYEFPGSPVATSSESGPPAKANFLVQNHTDRGVLRLSMTNRASYEWVHKDMDLPPGKQMPIVSMETIQPSNCMRSLKLTLESSEPYSLGRVDVCRLKLIDVKKTSNGTVVSVVDTTQRNLLFPSLATVSSRP